MYDYREKLEIDLKDLFKFIMRGWKLLIVASIIGGILGAACGSKSVRDTLAEEKASTDINAVISNLTPKEKSEVELAYRAYQQCLDLYDRLDKPGEEISSDTRVELVKAAQQIVDISYSFSADQKLYYASLFEDGSSGELTANDSAIYNEIDYSVTRKNIAKYIIIGIICGAFAIVFFYVIKYVLSPTLKTENDLRTAFGVPIIGTLTTDSDTELALICARIETCAKKSGMKMVNLVSSSEDQFILDKQTKTSNVFGDKDIEVTVKGSILKVNSCDEITDSNGIILFETIGLSKYEDIARELELCNFLGITVLGSVVINCQ